MKKILTILMLSVLILSSCWKQDNKIILETVDKSFWENAISNKEAYSGTKKTSWISSKNIEEINVSEKKWDSNSEKIWNSWRIFNK